jgi:hypothetical protein
MRRDFVSIFTASLCRRYSENEFSIVLVVQDNWCAGAANLHSLSVRINGRNLHLLNIADRGPCKTGAIIYADFFAKLLISLSPDRGSARVGLDDRAVELSEAHYRIADRLALRSGQLREHR